MRAEISRHIKPFTKEFLAPKFMKKKKKIKITPELIKELRRIAKEEGLFSPEYFFDYYEVESFLDYLEKLISTKKVEENKGK